MPPQVHAPKLTVIYIGSNDLSAAQCGGGEATLMAAVPGIVSRCARRLPGGSAVGSSALALPGSMHSAATPTLSGRLTQAMVVCRDARRVRARSVAQIVAVWRDRLPSTRILLVGRPCLT